jgi:cyclase
MLGIRAIPVLLLGEAGLVKTTRFRSPVYVGDPINAVRIFNEKEVDEIVLLDICATPEGRPPQFDKVRQIAGECFMPLCYGGGVGSLEDVEKLVGSGVEKVSINSRAVDDPAFVRAAADRFASSTIVVSIDVRQGWWGRKSVWTRGGRHGSGRDPIAFAKQMEDLGAGELLLTSIDRDGTMRGYDLDLIRAVADAVTVPVVACGGAGSVQDLHRAIGAHASASAAGSLFVFHGRHRAVLISYPAPDELAPQSAPSPEL